MNKFIAGILAFLLWLMPWSVQLYGWHAQYSFDRNATMNKIATCLKSRDVATFESMMRPWFKANEPNLTIKLEQFFDAIEGNVISVGSGGEGSSRSQGIYSEELNFGIYTTEQTYPNYYLWISYDVSNSNSKNDVGISLIHLQVGKNSDPGKVILFTLRVT